jgi:hypothetical protein
MNKPTHLTEEINVAKFKFILTVEKENIKNGGNYDY